VKKVLYDTNVILDVLLERQPHVAASSRAMDFAGRAQLEGYVAGHAVATIFYLVERAAGRARAREVLADLLGVLRVAPVNDAVTRRALAGKFADLEDGLCHEAAVEVEAAIIVTRNVRDFRKGSIRAVLPAALHVDAEEETPSG
jgi:predicted nucleic acid-binding protein